MARLRSPISIGSSPVLPIQNAPQPQPQAQVQPVRSASPDLPSPSAFIRRIPSLVSGSHRAQASQGVDTGFTSASHIYRALQLEAKIVETHGNEQNVDPGNATGAKVAQVAKPRKSRARKTEQSVDGEQEKIAPRNTVKRKRVPKKSTVDAEAIDENRGVSSDKEPTKRKRAPNKVARSEGGLEGDQEGTPAKEPAKRKRVAKPPPLDGELATKPKKAAKRVKKAAEAATATENTGTEAGAATVEPKARKSRIKSSNGLGSALPTAKAPTRICTRTPASVAEGTAVTPHTTESLVLPLAPQLTAHESGDDSFPDVAIEAPRRRVSWTPPRDSELPPSFQPGQAMDRSDSEIASVTDNMFTSLLGNYGYQAAEPPVVPGHDRKTSGKASTKRARIDITETARVVKAAPKKKAAATKPKKAPAKIVRSPKKKPLTITDLATAAYKPRPIPDITDGVRSVSEFFAAPQPVESLVPDGLGPEAEKADTEQPALSNPRKTVSNPKADGVTGAAKRKTTKSKTTKNVEPPPDLPSPETARQMMREQQFLFGTSSQLAREDSPTFLRHLQQALLDSEELAAGSQSQHSPLSSRRKVLSAPHGTSLSTGQGKRGLWASAARDDDMGILAVDMPSAMASHNDVANDQLLPPGQSPGIASDAEESPLPLIELVQDPRSPCLASQGDEQESELHDSGFVSIDQFDSSQSATKPVSSQQNKSLAHSHTDMTQSLYGHGRAEETRTKREVLQHRSTTHLDNGRVESSTPREALQPLDANASPHKAASATGDKATVQAKLTKSSIVHIGAKPAKRPVGRPRKSAASDSAPKAKRTPVRRKGTSPFAEQAEWTHIDDISDHEPPPTPSPPRRRHSSSPPAQTLDLLTADGVLEPSQPVVEVTAKASKADEWSAQTTILFPQITKAIKAAPRTTDPAHPSWYEKILLYDPIVLEDLTAWLNAQGLRVESVRAKTGKTAVGKGKKKVHAEELPLLGVGEQSEMVMEELKPAMVQKWAEENSVCCLWKEGLRGGVRMRY